VRMRDHEQPTVCIDPKVRVSRATRSVCPTTVNIQKMQLDQTKSAFYELPLLNSTYKMNMELANPIYC
jgi:hypothetical protein